MKKKSKSFFKGQSLIEVAIALGIAALIITGLLTSVLSSLDSAQFSKNLNIATQYSQEGIEAMRAKVGIEDGKYCLDEAVGTNPPELQNKDACNSGPLRDTPNIDNFFKRYVDVKHSHGECGGDLTRVEVVTAWQDGKCDIQSNKFCHESKLVSCLNNL